MEDVRFRVGLIYDNELRVGFWWYFDFLEDAVKFARSLYGADDIYRDRIEIMVMDNLGFRDGEE